MSEELAENPIDPEFRGATAAGMRARNERLVLTLVRRHGALAKSEIARMTGLSAQTVSVIMRRLEDDGLLLRGDPVRGKVGQPSVPMRLNPDGARFLGLKIGRRSAELVLTDFLGTVRDRERVTYAYPTPDAALDFTETAIGRLTGRMPRADRDRLAGLGIAMPFYLWDWAQTLRVPSRNMAAWREVDIHAEIAARYPIPVFMQNDATAACGAELVFGPQDGARDFLYFYVGFFIGGGIVLNGSLFSGRGNAGALGPLPVPAPGGAVRPLIDVASLYILERRMVEAGHAADALWLSSENWEVPAPLLDRWIEEAATGLVHAIVSTCAVIDVEEIRIDGWLPAEVRARLVAAVDRAMSGYNLTGLERPSIVAGSVGPDARAVGAACLPLSNRFLIEA